MIGITFLVMLLMLLTLREFVIGFVIRRKRKKIEHELRVECTQRHFAENRNRLLQLVIDHKLSADSETFRSLYHLHTGIMRRPDYYPELSKLFAYIFINGHNGQVNDSLLIECKGWTQEIKEVVIATADAMSYLIISHSRLLRTMYKLDRALNLKSTPSTLIRNVASKAEKVPASKHPLVKQIRRTQVAMYEMAGSH